MGLLSSASIVNGPSVTPDFFDVGCVVVVFPGEIIEAGSPLCRNVAREPLDIAPDSLDNLDLVGTPNDPRSGGVFGVYQGPPLTNPPPATTARFIETIVRRYGYGKLRVLVRTSDASGLAVGVKLSVGNATGIAQAYQIAPASIVWGLYVGRAAATGNAVNVGDVIQGPVSVDTPITINAWINPS